MKRVPVLSLIVLGALAPRAVAGGSAEAGLARGIPGFPCYRSVQETFAALDGLAARFPALATRLDIGDSWEKSRDPGRGHDLVVLRLSNQGVVGPKPRLFISSALHARELATAELSLRFVEWLAERHGLDPDVTWILDHHEIHVLVLANPDGRVRAERGNLWRKNTDADYCVDPAGIGVDLNRNFSFAWACCGGASNDPCNERYRGAAAATEPETRAIQAYLREIFPQRRGLDAAAAREAPGLMLDVHSPGRLVLSPWGFAGIPPDGPALRRLARKLAFFNGYTPIRAVELYVADGTAADFAYGELGLAAIGLELGNSFFESCSAFEDSVWPENLPALLYVAKAARAPFALPAGPDTLDVRVGPRVVTAGARAMVTARIDDTRFSGLDGTEPAQPIAAAAAFLDVPPWSDPAAAVPLAAVDGAFDQPAESVWGWIETRGLALGRHLVATVGK
jgi:hypothetical protein